jgi:glutamate/tyrosine decarboxylase-like PLP-dependent enzyme
MSNESPKQIMAQALAGMNVSLEFLNENAKALMEGLAKSEDGKLPGTDEEQLALVEAADRVGFIAEKFMRSAQGVIASYAATKASSQEGYDTLTRRLDKNLDELHERIKSAALGQGAN